MIHSMKMGVPDGLPTVMLHCFLGHSGGWAGFLKALPAPLDVLAYDLPGHGRSAMPEDPGDFYAMSAGVAAEMITRPSLLIGHSFGAATMLRFALRNPEMVKGMVLIEPVFFAAARDEPEFEPYVETERPLHAAIQAEDLDAAAQHFLSLNVGSPDWNTLPKPAQQLMARQMNLVGATFDGIFFDTGNLLEPGLMEGFKAPVLLITGEHTTGIFKATTRGLSQRLPNASCVEIAGSGHMAPITDPVATAEQVQAWLLASGLT